MLGEIISKINPVDVIIALIFLRCLYIGLHRGFVVEFFKLLGMILATFITLHYYSHFAYLLGPLVFIPYETAELLSFCLLWLFIVVIFKVVREGWMIMINPEEKISVVQKIGGIVVAIPRAFLICGMAFLLVFSSRNFELSDSAHKSFCGFYLMDISPQIYNTIYEGLIKKVFPNEAKNSSVFKLKSLYLRSKKKK